MIAHSADRYAPGDSLGIPNLSTADLPKPVAGAGAMLVPLLVLIALAVLVDRMGRG